VQSQRIYQPQQIIEFNAPHSQYRMVQGQPFNQTKGIVNPQK